MPSRWIVVCCAVAFALGFSLAAAFEIFIYDVPAVSQWWDMDILVGGLVAWTTLMALGAVRVRFDGDGVHRRSLLRRRSLSWARVERIGLRAPLLRLPRSVLALSVDGRWHATPPLVNMHPGGAPALFEHVALLARRAGAAVDLPVADPTAIVAPLDIR